MTLEQLYSQYIKPLSLEDRMKIIVMTAQDIEGIIADKQPLQHSLLELEGVGAELWNQVEAQKYVNDLRTEWDQRP